MDVSFYCLSLLVRKYAVDEFGYWGWSLLYRDENNQ